MTPEKLFQELLGLGLNWEVIESRFERESGTVSLEIGETVRLSTSNNSSSRSDPISERQLWCAREDLNLHPLRDQILSLACLPFHHSRTGLETYPAFPTKLKVGFTS